MIDALGFKGIWREPNGASAAIATLESALSTANGILGYYARGLGPKLQLTLKGEQPRITVRSLSDTIVIAAEAPASADTMVTDGGLPAMPIFLDMVCQALGYVIRTAAKETRPLVYRGTVAAGALLTERSFVIGPAVDEAAELMNAADGAFVWLTPSAAAIPPPTHKPNVWSTYAVPYRVPMKNGSTYGTTTVAPFADTRESIERATIRAGFARAMKSERIDVCVKSQNTERYLDFIDAFHAKLHAGG